MREVELLAPGGDSDSVKAAILAGADAVFLGVSEFNARKRAKNIGLADLEKLLTIAHDRGVKLYITLNTLLAEEDSARIVPLVAKLVNMGVDALIVQDYGLLGLLSKYRDTIEVHASTQMTTHNCDQLTFLSKLGVKQVNLSRELSLQEIEILNKRAREVGVKSEVFVHGAFCVSYSGQCYFSTKLYGLSGNTGTCVQPCRRDFSGKDVSTCSPFNLKDNSAFSSIGELVAIGSDSLKIEGRVKGPEYVHTVVKTYRQQLDRVLSGDSVEDSSRALQTVFNRDFTDGYLQGEVSKDMFTPNSKDQSLEKVGTVVTYSADRRELKLKSAPIFKGAELHIRDKHNKFVCKGRVKRVMSDNSYHFVIEDKMQGRIYKGYTVYQKQQEHIEKDFADNLANLSVPQLPIQVSGIGKLGETLKMRASYRGKSVELSSQSKLQEASARPLTVDTIREKFGKLGGTDYALGEVKLTDFDKNLFLPIKELNEMKREMVSFFDSHNEEKEHFHLSVPEVTNKSRFRNNIALLVNRPEDLLLSKEVDTTLYEMPLVISKEIEEVFTENRGLIPWFQPILTETQLQQCKDFLAKHKVGTIVSENSGLAYWASSQGIEVIAGPHFNLTNSFSVQTMKECFEAQGVFLSKELSAEQIAEVFIPEGVDFWFPLVEHQLLMNTRQCLVRNTLGCKKHNIDESCLEGCNRSTFVSEKQGKEILVTKRDGYNNQIYFSKMRYNKRACTALKNRVDYWLMDLRDVPSRTKLKYGKAALLKSACVQIKTGREEILSHFESVDSTPLSPLK